MIKTIIGIIVSIFIIGLIIIGYFSYKSIINNNFLLQNEVVKFKKLTEDLIRSNTEWVKRKDIEKELKNLMTKEDLKKVKEDLKKLNSNLNAIGKTIGVVEGKVSQLENSDAEGDETSPVEICKETGKAIDIHGYTKKVQIKKIKDINSASIASVEFDASKKAPWNYEVFRKEYKLITILGKKESGQLTFHHQLQYSIPSISNKFYPINILSSEYKQVPEKNEWFWLNPVLDANFFIGGMFYKIGNGFGRTDNILSMGVDVGLSLSSYGTNKVDSLFRLFRFGLGYNIERRAGTLSFSPITFNIGKPLPLLTNLYFSPQISIDTAGGLILNAGIGPQF